MSSKGNNLGKRQKENIKFSRSKFLQFNEKH